MGIKLAQAFARVSNAISNIIWHQAFGTCIILWIITNDQHPWATKRMTLVARHISPNLVYQPGHDGFSRCGDHSRPIWNVSRGRTRDVSFLRGVIYSFSDCRGVDFGSAGGTATAMACYILVWRPQFLCKERFLQPSDIQFPIARGAKMAIVPPREDPYQLQMRVGDAPSFFEKTRLWKERLFPLVVRILHCTGTASCSC